MRRINASEHALIGAAVCSMGGQVVWYGPLEQLPPTSEFDTIHCHEADVAVVAQRLAEAPRPAAKVKLRRRATPGAT